MSLDEIIIVIDPEDIHITLDPFPDAVILATGGLGQRGPIGPQGVIGPQGIQGVQGSQGVQGTQGPQGSQGVQGPVGSTGTGITMQGSVALVGDLPPSGNTQGDAYIVQSDDSLHIWDGSAWISGGPIQGPQGAQGPTGPQGVEGPEGPEGDVGPQGEDITYDGDWAYGKSVVASIANNLITADRLNVFKITTLRDIELVALRMHGDGFGGGVGTQVLKPVVYADSAGSPGALLGVGSEVTISQNQAAGWILLPIVLSMPEGVYHIGWISGGTSVVGRFSAEALGTDRKNRSDITYAGGAPNPFGTATLSDNFHASLHTMEEFEVGDIVVYNRISYLCVRTTTTVPAPWTSVSDPATTDWVPIGLVPTVAPGGQIWIPGGALIPSLTLPCSIAQYEAPTNDINVLVADFTSDTATMAGEVGIVLPSHYAGETFTAKFYWFTPATSSLVCTWFIQGRAWADGDVLDAANGSGQTVDDANAGVANQVRVSAPSVPITLNGSPAAGEYANIRIARLGGHGNDTLVGGARLLGVLLEF